jgi:hypothetical protein
MMTAEILPFGFPRPVAQERIRILWAKGQYVIEPKFSQALADRDRGITMPLVSRVMAEGSINQGPSKDDYGDWRCRVRKRVAGKLVRVVVAIHEERILYLVTTY